MAESSGLVLDEWGHVETFEIMPSVWVGVVERNDRAAPDLKARIVVSVDKPPDRGYDYSYGYKTVEDASAALQGWDYQAEPEPPDCVRNFQTHPIED